MSAEPAVSIAQSRRMRLLLVGPMKLMYRVKTHRRIDRLSRTAERRCECWKAFVESARRLVDVGSTESPCDDERTLTPSVEHLLETVGRHDVILKRRPFDARELHALICVTGTRARVMIRMTRTPSDAAYARQRRRCCP
jgi:hypothetical protein